MKHSLSKIHSNSSLLGQVVKKLGTSLLKKLSPKNCTTKSENFQELGTLTYFCASQHNRKPSNKSHLYGRLLGPFHVDTKSRFLFLGTRQKIFKKRSSIPFSRIIYNERYRTSFCNDCFTTLVIVREIRTSVGCRPDFLKWQKGPWRFIYLLLSKNRRKCFGIFGLGGCFAELYELWNKNSGVPW